MFVNTKHAALLNFVKAGQKDQPPNNAANKKEKIGHIIPFGYSKYEAMMTLITRKEKIALINSAAKTISWPTSPASQR